MVPFRYLLLSVLALVAFSSENGCLERCRLRFCDYSTSFRLHTEPNVSFTGPICSAAGARVGRVAKAHEAHLIDRDRDINISQWHPFGLNGTFPAHFFTPAVLLRGKSAPVSAISHTGIHQGNLEVLHNRCFVMPIAEYQLLSANGHVARVIKEKQCIAFHTFVFSEGSVY